MLFQQNGQHNLGRNGSFLTLKPALVFYLCHDYFGWYVLVTQDQNHNGFQHILATKDLERPGEWYLNSLVSKCLGPIFAFSSKLGLALFCIF